MTAKSTKTDTSTGRRIARLALEREILLHHRSGRVGHGAGPSERARDWGVAAAPFPL